MNFKHTNFLSQFVSVKNVPGLKIPPKCYFFLWQNSSLGCSTLLHTKTAINNLFKTVFRITTLCTEAEINRFFEEQTTWYTLYEYNELQ